MKKIYIAIERQLELLTLKATKILGNSITFILAFCLVFFFGGHIVLLFLEIFKIVLVILS